MLEMLEMLGESVSTGQNQGVSIGAKPEETMEEMGGKNCRNGEIVVLNAACTLVIPGAPHFWFYFWGGCGASGCMWHCGKLPKLLVPPLPHPHDGANLSAHRRDRWGSNIDRCGRSAQNGLPVCTLQFLTFHNLLI